MEKKIVVVGGVAGGASAAAKARRQDEFCKIIIFEKGAYISFANCGLPYYISGEIAKRESLLLHTPESFKTRHNIEVKPNHEVLKIIRGKKCIQVKDLASGKEFEEKYDKLILATGALPIIPTLPGIQARNCFSLRSIPDTDNIFQYLAHNSVTQGAIVGGGYIGLEMAEALLARGFKVTVIEKADQLLLPMDKEMSQPIVSHLREKGVALILKDGVKEFLLNKQDCVQEIVLDSGRKIPTEIVVSSIGIKPDTLLAKDAALKIGPTGAIEVNECMETSDPDIYAVGDCTESTHLVTGKKVWIALAGPANKQGRVAGANAAGGNKTMKGVLGTAIVKVCDLVAARTGLNEREAQQAGLNYYCSYTHGEDHAGYYPGAQPLTIKLIVEKGTGRLLGAQVTGRGGVDKRIDILSTAIYSRFTISDLENLDLAYAPQFGSARDPVITAGFVAQNILQDEVAALTSKELMEEIEAGKKVGIIDVRTPREHAESSISGSTLIPIDELRSRLDELPSQKEEELILHCGSGLRSYLAYRVLKAYGFTQVKNLSGGITSWRHNMAAENK
jgi:NADPH-dependent 2,4-dienoyl-CoA reductase/sulfur reductase-like enzyme/rhodanese-related sulfurtransferase